MGCAISTSNNEEGVARCRARKRFLKHAVASRHALAFAHAQYLQALKGSGAAFRELGEGEDRELLTSPTSPASLVTAAAALPPPPPPIFSIMPPSPPGHVDHSRSFEERGAAPFFLEILGGSPFSSLSKECLAYSAPPHCTSPEDWHDPRKADRFYSSRPPPPAPHNTWHNLFLDPFRPVLEVEFRRRLPPLCPADQRKIIQRRGGDGELVEEEEMPDLEDVLPETNDEDDREFKLKTSDPEQPDVKAEIAVMKGNMTMGTTKTSPDNEIRMFISSRGKSLLEVFRELDGLFLKAAESGDSVCWMLETKKVHYHSSFSEIKGIADPTGNVSYSSFLSQSLSRSASSFPQYEDIDVHTVGENGETKSSHATTLDLLFAWERKLCEEVKSAEVIRIDLEKKCTLLRNQDVKGEDPLVIDKTRASVTVLHTRFIVALQAVDGASNAVDKLRDDELYLRLLELLEGLRNMWKEMLETHEAQHKIVQEVAVLKYSSAAESSSVTRQSTLQLATALSRWVQSFSSIISSQREYLSNLNGWLRLSLVQSDLELRKEQSKTGISPSAVSTTPIFLLCEEWQRALDRLPQRVALDSINGFGDVVKKWVRLQSEEFKHKKKADSLERELNRKEQFLESLERKYFQSTLGDEDYEHSTESPRKASLSENRGRVNQLRLKVEQEKEDLDKSIHAARVMILDGIQHLLPGVFNSMTLFASIAYQIYKGLSASGSKSKLRCITS